MAEFRRPAAAITVATDPIKGSRFIADVGPAEDPSAAAAFLAAVREREPGATHHCSAWRIGPDRAQADDDGEPRGTAGQPILRRIDSSGIDRVMVVVTRYYGGTKLGTGGLVRAYGETAKAGLDAVEVAVGHTTAVARFEHGYDLSTPVAAVLAGHDAVTLEADYGETVRLRVAVLEEDGPAFVAALREATAGRVEAVLEG